MLLDDQVTDLSTASEGWTVAVSVWVVPTASEMEELSRVTPVTLGFTVTAQLAFFAPSFVVTVMMAVPTDLATTTPEDVTVATDTLSEAQVTDLSVALDGDTVAVIDTSRDPEWRLKARIVRRVRTFGDSVVARVTIGTVQPVDYASVSSLAADVAALQSDVTGIDGNLTTAASVTVVENTVTTEIDDLDELAELEF